MMCLGQLSLISLPKYNCAVDACFLLDGSGSMNGDRWEVEKPLVLGAINAFAVASSNIIVAQFSDWYGVIARGSPITLDRVAVAAARRSVGGTNMDAGIRGCISDLQHGNATGNPQMIILLTDGEPNSESAAMAAATDAKAAGIKMITVGVGSSANLVLLSYLSSSNVTLTAKNFDDYSVATLAKQMSEAICETGKIQHSLRLAVDGCG